MKHPFAVLRILFFAVRIRFITAAGQFPSAFRIHTESILFCLGRLDIKEADVVPDDIHRFTVMNLNQMQTVVNESRLLRTKQLSGKIPDQIQNFFM